jgi:AraC-like DNA-binding protein
MAYRELPPPPELAHLVRCLWIHELEGGANPILPDGCADLVVADGAAMIAGPDTGPVPVRHAPGAVVAGVRFHPGAAAAALGVPVDELRDRRVPLGALWGDTVAAALGERGTGDPAALARALLGRLRQVEAPDARVRAAARQLSRAPGTPLPALADAVDLGERQLRRRFAAAVGYGPKTFARVIRFRAALGLVRGGAALAEAALAAGYADQAHMTREMRALAGATPGALAP